ncbi:MAG: hypothetical protein N4A76_08665 [Firmicutes bacterium]|jgi:hypothetical protein|nr:hypothetical protein [Bacillota bacterium]
MEGRLSSDKNGNVRQLFFPKEGVTLTSPYIPDEDMEISPAGDMTITLNGVSKTYLEGDVFGLTKGISYIITGTLAAHKA